MSENKIDLSSVGSRDLMMELKSRGYYTDLIFGFGDVDFQLESINDGRDEQDQIVLTEDDKREILNLCFNTDWYSERMNDDISDHIIDNYEK